MGRPMAPVMAPYLTDTLRPVLHARPEAAALMYTVQTGDSISGVSQSKCGTPADWTGIYAASRKLHLTARNANYLDVGQQLAIQCYQEPRMAGRAWTPPPPPAPVYVPPVEAAPVSVAAVQNTYQAPQRVASATYSGSGSMEQCIIARESGGNAQAVNASSGAGGLYQFLPSTWASLGHSGLPENAPVAEQNQAFRQEVAQDGGYSAWTPYDGC